MNQEKCFSDEFLNAFVDNQIDAEEKGRAYVEISRNEEINRQVCELRKLHDLVQLAYREPPTPPPRTTSSPITRHARLRFGVAASVLLTLGIVLGSQIRVPGTAQSATAVPTVAVQRVSKSVSVSTTAAHTRPIQSDATAKADIAKHMAKLSTVAVNSAAVTATTPVSLPAVASHAIPDNSTTKVLIHLARDDAVQLSQALDDIESTLKYYREIHQSARVEVVVNGKGLELVRIDTSAFAARIQRLQREYSNLTFAACQNTIDRLTREQGIIVRLLPGVVTIDSGMAEIMRRQNQGWTYLQV